MFWDATIGALSLLKFPSVWIGAIVVGASGLVFPMVLASMGRERGVGPSSALGCLGGAILGTLAQGVALALYLTLVLPLILGGDELTPLSFVRDNLGAIAYSGLLGIGAALLTAFLPVVGRSHSLGTFVQGVVVCRLLAGPSLDQVLSARGGEMMYPGLVPSLGFLAVAFALSLLAVLLFTLTMAKLGRDPEDDPLAVLLPPAFGAVFGVLPVFMYMRYALVLTAANT